MLKVVPLFVIRRALNQYAVDVKKTIN